MFSTIKKAANTMISGVNIDGCIVLNDKASIYFIDGQHSVNFTSAGKTVDPESTEAQRSNSTICVGKQSSLHATALCNVNLIVEGTMISAHTEAITLTDLTINGSVEFHGDINIIGKLTIGKYGSISSHGTIFAPKMSLAEGGKINGFVKN